MKCVIPPFDHNLDAMQSVVILLHLSCFSNISFVQVSKCVFFLSNEDSQMTKVCDFTMYCEQTRLLVIYTLSILNITPLAKIHFHFHNPF